MAIGFERKSGERVVIIGPDGKETWILFREGRARLAFDLPEGYRVLREEAYRREPRKPGEVIRPAITAPKVSPLAGTVFHEQRNQL